VALLFPLVVAKALEKELKRPDEFVSFWTHLGLKISQNRRTVIAVVVVAAIGGGAAWGSVVYRNSSAAKATAAFARIERIANAELLPEKAPDSEEGKAEAKAGAKAEAKPEDDGLPHFKTEKERQATQERLLQQAVKEAGATLLNRH